MGEDLETTLHVLPSGEEIKNMNPGQVDRHLRLFQAHLVEQEGLHPERAYMHFMEEFQAEIRDTRMENAGTRAQENPVERRTSIQELVGIVQSAYVQLSRQTTNASVGGHKPPIRWRRLENRNMGKVRNALVSRDIQTIGQIIEHFSSHEGRYFDPIRMTAFLMPHKVDDPRMTRNHHGAMFRGISNHRHILAFTKVLYYFGIVDSELRWLYPFAPDSNQVEPA